MCFSSTEIGLFRGPWMTPYTIPGRAATIQLPHDMIHITIFASRYDMYRDTFLTTLEP